MFNFRKSDKHMAWRQLDTFPISSDSDWAMRRGHNGAIKTGYQRVTSKLSSWTPYDPLLVSTKSGAPFLPVLDVPEICESVYKNLRFRSKMTLFVILGGLFCCALLWQLTQNKAAYIATVSTFALFTYAVIDYLTIICRLSALKERSLFFIYLYENKLSYGIFWLLLMLFVGGVQWIGQTALGGFDPFIARFGAVFSSINQGQWWRLLIGPFFHSSLGHWASNLFMLLIAGTISNFVSRRLALPVFLLGAIFGAIDATILASYTHSDAYGGVSAGIFALFGMCFAIGLKYPKEFPIGFSLSIISFSILNGILASFASQSTSNSAHLTGFITGCIVGSVCASAESETKSKLF